MMKRPTVRGIAWAYLFFVAITIAGVLLLFGWREYRNAEVRRFSEKAKTGVSVDDLVKAYDGLPRIYAVNDEFIGANAGFVARDEIPAGCRTIYSFVFDWTFNGTTFCIVMTDENNRILKSKLHYS